VKSVTIVPLDKAFENRLFEFMDQDRTSNFYAIYDLRHLKDRTQIWVAFAHGTIVGYLMEFADRILYMRGTAESAVPLLKNSDLSEPLFNIERHHLSAVKGLYELKEPADKMTRGQITAFLTLKATAKTFTPIIEHSVQKLEKKDAAALADLLSIEGQTALDFFRGFAFGVFKDGRLVSYAASPEMLEDLAIVRGVYTAPEERSKGYSTSVCSALVRRLLQEGRDVMLYVSRDNPAAIKVYRKIGFRETGHTQLGFLAKKRDDKGRCFSKVCCRDNKTA